MKRPYSIKKTIQMMVCIGFCIALSQTLVSAQTLSETLSITVQKNPGLDAIRQGVKILEERKTQADRLNNPTLGIDSSFGISRTYADNGNSLNANPLSASVVANQPLWTGGRTDSAITEAKKTIEQGKEELFHTQQTTLIDAVTAYMNVLRDMEVVSLNQNNVRVLEKQYQAVKTRFHVGDVTKTDVAQSEARLSKAKSDLVIAEGTLKASQAGFKQIVGEDPQGLVFPSALPEAPKDLDTALAQAYQQNPQLLSAIKAREVSSAGIDKAESELYPEISLRGTVNYTEQTATSKVALTQGVASANVSIPLYQGGAEYSRIQEAELLHGRRKLEQDQAQRKVEEDVVQSWAELEATKAALGANKDQVKAAELALEGVKQENTVGARTILDMLDAEQELLTAKVSVVRSKRDQMVASYNLQQAIGSDILKLVQLNH
jgi:outer membrane protein